MKPKFQSEIDDELYHKMLEDTADDDAAEEEMYNELDDDEEWCPACGCNKGLGEACSVCGFDYE